MEKVTEKGKAVSSNFNPAIFLSNLKGAGVALVTMTEHGINGKPAFGRAAFWDSKEGLLATVEAAPGDCRALMDLIGEAGFEVIVIGIPFYLDPDVKPIRLSQHVPIRDGISEH